MTHEGAPLTSMQLALSYIGIVLLVVTAGCTAGLQVALFSIDRIFLRVLRTTGDATQRAHAKQLLHLLSLQHWTLVSLILINASCMMALPILLEWVFDQLTALIVSITAVLFLGEVIPLAVFVRWAIPICGSLSMIIWAAIVITAPVSFPVGKLLDRLLGSEEELLDRDELAALIIGPKNEEDTTHGPEDEELSTTAPSTTSARRTSDARDVVVEPAGESRPQDKRSRGLPQLTEEEVKMMTGAMQLSSDTVQEHLRTKESAAFMVSSRAPLDRDTLESILHSGFSRIPVFFGDDRRHIVGALIVNSLVSLCYKNPDPPPLAGDYPLREVMRLSETSSLYDAYMAFRSGRSNMAVVYDSQGLMMGLMTLTDVLAAMYHADLSHKPMVNPQGIRRQHKMVELVDGMKLLNAARRGGNASFSIRDAHSPCSLQVDDPPVGSASSPTRAPPVMLSDTASSRCPSPVGMRSVGST